MNGLLQTQSGQSATPEQNVSTAHAQQPTGAQGGSVWDAVPAEENQYNYGGSYTQYFENIFAAELAAYGMDKSLAAGGKRVIYTFSSGGSKALVVELMSESCGAYKLRRDCEREHVPYLRFYYDHHGWWNTRRYVVDRLRKALNG